MRGPARNDIVTSPRTSPAEATPGARREATRGSGARRAEPPAKSIVVASTSAYESRMVRKIRLHQHFAARAAAGATPTCASSATAARWRGIGAVQRVVRTQHADQRKPREIMPLGEHLGADQDIDGPVARCARALLRTHLPAHGIAIDAHDARVRISAARAPPPAAACRCPCASRSCIAAFGARRGHRFSHSRSGDSAAPGRRGACQPCTAARAWACQPQAAHFSDGANRGG